MPQESIIQCCTTQGDLRYEFLVSGTFEFSIAELENPPTDFTVCIEGPTDPDRCKKEPRLSDMWSHSADMGNSITIWKSDSRKSDGLEFPPTFRNISSGASSETMTNRLHKPDGWRGNNLEWMDVGTNFKISINVKKVG